MRAILLFVILFTNALFANTPQPPLIVEFDTFKAAERICKGSDYTKLPCLFKELRAYNNKIYTKISGTRAKFSVIFYAITQNGEITYPSNIANKTCIFTDTLGRKMKSNLSGNGISYVLDYPLPASSSKTLAFLSCGFSNNEKFISQITQGISVMPSHFDISFSMQNALGNSSTLNAPNDDILVLKTQSHLISINANATARTINGEVDRGFSDDLVPISLSFNKDNGLCSSVGERISGRASFNNGILNRNNLNLSFEDVASGELEIAFTHRLDASDRASGKCLLGGENVNDIANVGKIPCQKPIVLRKRLDIVPYSFYANIQNDGKQIYYNQHTFAPAIINLPTMNITLSALNANNALLKNFTKDCYAKDISIKLDDNKNNLLFINENLPDSSISKDTFLADSKSSVTRKLSSSGIKDRDLTPLDLFNSSVLNLNDTMLNISFNLPNYPLYMLKPKISKDWRIALLRGRISLQPNTNSNSSLVANPTISYELYCKSPTCKVLDLESLLSPSARFPKSNVKEWYINTAHPQNLKVSENNLALPSGLSVYSTGNVVGGIQTLAIQSQAKGSFDIKIKQGYGSDDFALFLYFAPNYINIRDDLGVSTRAIFNDK